MKDINTVTLSGRLVKEAELRDVGSTKKARFTIASNHSKKSGGDWVEFAGFFDCTAWKGTAEFIAKQPKVTFVVVSGHLRHEVWEGKDGKRSKVEINCEDVKVMTQAKKEERDTPNGGFDDKDLPF